MTPRTAMSEESMQPMEALITMLAHIEVRGALAIAVRWWRLAMGQLIESHADGTVRVIRTIAKPVAVAS